MSRTVRAIFSALPIAAVIAVGQAPPAIADFGCNNLCRVEGDLTVTVTRSTPCANFGGNVCYILSWSAQVSANSSIAGSYTATTTPDAGAGHSKTCFFTNPPTSSCSTSGQSNTFIDIIPPNSTKCRSFTSTLKNAANTTVATDSGSVCRSVGS